MDILYQNILYKINNTNKYQLKLIVNYLIIILLIINNLIIIKMFLWINVIYVVINHIKIKYH